MSKHIVVDGKPRNIKGWKSDRPDHRDLALGSCLKVTGFPDHIDLRSYCSPVENQYDIGSCTANAGTSAMEFLAIKLGKQRINFSRLFLYYAERVNIEHGDPETDSGAHIRDTMKSLAKYGVCEETTWPYVANKFSVMPPKTAWCEASYHQILEYYRCYGLNGVRSCLASGRSVVAGFSVPKSIQSDKTTKSGIVDYPQPSEEIIGGHAVHLVGYNDIKKQILFQNSWGINWGDKGFGYLDYKFFTTGLASDFWTIKNEEW